MKYATTIHLSPADLIAIIREHLRINDTQVVFNVGTTLTDKPVFTGADVKVPADIPDLRPPPKPNK